MKISQLIEFILLFPSLLLPGKIPIGVTERGSLKKYHKRCISRYSKVVHNIKLPLTYSEFTMHMENQLKQTHLQSKAGFLYDMHFFSYAHVMK